MDDVPRIHLPQSDATVKRRRDVAIDDLQLRGIDLRLIGPDCAVQLIHQRLLRVDLLLRNASRWNQRRISLQVQLRIAQLCLVAKQLCLHLIELGLEGTSIDFDEQISLLDVLTLPKVHLHDLPVNSALNVGGVKCGDRTQARQVNGYVLPLHLRNGDRDGTWPRSLRFLLFRVSTTATAKETCAYCRKNENRYGGCWGNFHAPCSIRKINHI